MSTSRATNRRRAPERGVVIPITALVLVPLLVISAFAIDVGSWYAQTSRMQRAADAAALAGVVWMPNEGLAQSVALETAAQNGFAHDPSGTGVTVSVQFPGDSQLRVVISAPGDLFLGGLVLDDEPDFSRSATAEYVLPVPLGSPRNFFGTGNLSMVSGYRENFWAAVNGYCAGHESGDLHLARYESYSTADANGSRCSGGSAQTPEYDPSGYLYAVEVPAGTVTLQIYDAAFFNTGSAMDLRLADGNQTISTVYEVYAADTTPLDRTDNPLVATVNANTGQTIYQNQWRTIYSGATIEGTVYLRVRTAADLTESRATNGFAIRAYMGGTWAACTTIGPSADEDCPQVHGVDDMSIFANLASGGGSGTATFYLAEVAATHAGKTMRVTLFDSGEGASQIEILDPNGDPVNFTWETPCSPPTPPTGGCSGSGNALDVSGTGTQPVSGLQSSSRYNNRRMILDVPIPSDYVAQFGTDEWWQIRYTVDSSPTDRTTWSVVIVGDPVHLIE